MRKIICDSHLTRPHVLLPFDTEAFLATGAYHGMLAFCFGKAENGAALGAFPIDVGFSITEAVAE